MKFYTTQISVVCIVLALTLLPWCVYAQREVIIDEWGWGLESGCLEEDIEKNRNVIKSFSTKQWICRENQQRADSVIIAYKALAECAYFNDDWKTAVQDFKNAQDIARSEGIPQDSVFNVGIEI